MLLLFTCTGVCVWKMLYIPFHIKKIIKKTLLILSFIKSVSVSVSVQSFLVHIIISHSEAIKLVTC